MEINATKLCTCYGKHTVINNMDINIKKGEITSIIGPNGSGKSTILKTLSKIIKYNSGTIYLNRRNICSYENKEFARHIGMLPQKPHAPIDFKVIDLVSYGRIPYNKWYSKNSEHDKEVIEWALKVTDTWKIKDKVINECSGGEAQRIWIATVLCQQPEILFLDEPTTYLDISHQLEIMNLLKKLNRDSGIGIVMVLHDISQAIQISDKIIVIKNGKKYCEGSPFEVVTSRMMKEVYNVDCDIVNIKNRNKPIIVYKEIS